jgi:hypothetical protein
MQILADGATRVLTLGVRYTTDARRICISTDPS